MFRLTKQELFAIGVLVLVVAAVAVGLTVGRRPKAPGIPVDIQMNTQAPAAVEENTGGEDGPTLVVHVTGAVEHPDTYTLPEGSRVKDAVLAAAPAREADTHAMNLATLLHDGDKIVVPTTTEPAHTPAGVVLGAPRDERIDLNSATQAELDTLPGIGPVRAQSIIEHRAGHRFKRIEDIMKVSGIGQGTFEKIKGKIIVR